MDNTLAQELVSEAYALTSQFAKIAERLEKVDKQRRPTRIYPGLAVQDEVAGFCVKPKDSDKSYVLANQGEYVAVIALPGTAKTQVSEASSTSYLKNAHKLHAETLGIDIPAFRRKDGSIRPVVYIDTERTDAANKKSNKKIHLRLQIRYPEPGEEIDPRIDRYLARDGGIEGLEHYAFLSIETPEQCRYWLDTLSDELSELDEEGEPIPGTGPAFYVIDGILDFAESLNGEELAKSVVKWLRSNLNRRQATGLVTMHPNKGTADFAGHLGGFIYRWCASAILLRISDVDPAVRLMTCERALFPSAKVRHESNGFTLAMAWDESSGYMTECEVPAEDRASKRAAGVVLDDIRQVFVTHLLNGIEHVPCGAAKAMLCERKAMAERTADTHFASALKKGWIKSSGNGKATVYTWIYDDIRGY